jgi:hypothetical protein
VGAAATAAVPEYGGELQPQLQEPGLAAGAGAAGVAEGEGGQPQQEDAMQQ